MRYRRRQAQTQEIREALLNAGLALFTEQGFTATTVEAITRRAGVAKGTFYYYFKTKEELAIEAMVPFLSEIEAKLDKGPFATQFASLAKAFEAWAQPNPELVWLWAVEHLRRGYQAEGSHRFHDLFTQMVAGAQARGELRPDRSVQELTLSLEGLIVAQLAHWYHSGQTEPLAVGLGRAFTIFIEGAKKHEEDA